MLHTSGPRAAATALVLAASAMVLPALPLVGPAGAQTVPPSEADDPLTEALAARSDGALTIERDDVTGAVTFVGTPPGEPMATPQESSGGAEAAAGDFVDEFGTLFGATETGPLEQAAVTPRLDGGATVTYHQVVDEVPVVGGELRVQTDGDGDVLSALGELQPALDVSTTPGSDAATAADRAVTVMAAVHGADAAALTTSDPTLAIFAPDLLGGPSTGPPRLTWRLDVTGPDTPEPFRELVLVDATSGAIALHFDQVAAGLDRTVCDRQNVVDDDPTCSEPFARTEDSPATLDPDIDKAYEYAGDTYEYFAQQFGRDSLDDAGLPLVSTVRFCPATDPCPYQNAFWDGQQMAYGETFSQADDIVGHEFTHGFTERTSGLFYYFQSGAINESLSDIFGELIDLSNGAGNDTPGVRLLIGEDLPQIGVFRSLRNPPAFWQPARMLSGLYTQDLADSGGVHTNSGVGNRAAALLIDGGTFNNYTVQPLGEVKAGRIYYELATTLLGSASDYIDLRHALPQACNNLVGIEGITTTDCTQVESAVMATEMWANPSGAPTATDDRPCRDDEVPSSLFEDDLEDPESGNWVTTVQGVTGPHDTWSYPQNPNAYGIDATYATSGTTNFFAAGVAGSSDASIQRTADLAIPENSYLVFEHSYEYATAGGGQVDYSTDGGLHWTWAGNLTSAPGQPVTASWGGISNGYGTARLSLRDLAGQNVRFRFRSQTSWPDASLGWFIDDVRVVQCLPHYGQPDLAIRLGARGTLAGSDVIRSTPKGQVASATVGRRGTATFRVVIENQGVTDDTIEITGPACSATFCMRYFDHTTDISSPVADGWTTPTLAPGETYTIKAVVTASRGAPIGAIFKGDIRGLSTTTATRIDFVRAKVTRTR